MVNTRKNVVHMTHATTVLGEPNAKQAKNKNDFDYLSFLRIAHHIQPGMGCFRTLLNTDGQMWQELREGRHRLVGARAEQQTKNSKFGVF